MLQRKGAPVNLKTVRRRYCEHHLQVRKRRRKKLRVFRKPNVLPSQPSERWSLDFVADSLASGNRFRTLNVFDDFTRDCLAIEVDFSLTGHRVTRVLEKLNGKFRDECLNENWLRDINEARHVTEDWR